MSDTNRKTGGWAPHQTGPMTYAEAADYVVATDPTYAVTTAVIRGIEYKVFKNVPDNVHGLLELGRAAHDDGKAHYLLYEGERWTFDEFRRDVYRLAKALSSEFGVTKGTRVALCSRNCPEMLMAILAISSLGGVTIFLNSWWTTPELDYAIGDSGASLILADGQRCERLLPIKDKRKLTLLCQRDPCPDYAVNFHTMLDRITEADPPTVVVEPEDDFAVMYSSGTTGQPKGVILTHRGTVNAVYCGSMLDETGPLMAPSPPPPPEYRNSVTIVTPLFHVTATHPCFFWSLISGAALTVFPKWDAEKVVATIRDENITRFISVPTQSMDLMEAARRMGETLPSLFLINSGGAKRPASQVEPLAKAFPHTRIGSAWGMTETNILGILGSGPTYIARPDSTGRLIPPLQDVRFLDDEGNDVPPGEVGELTLKSCCVMRGYLNKPAETAAVFQDGWLRTGDLARMDEEGFIYIVDRKKDTIIRGGENIACLEVDGALHQHPDIQQACVFSIPDERFGEIVGAGILLKPGCSLTADDITAFLKPKLAAFKIPVRYWFLTEALPLGHTHKVDRRALRALCLAKDEKARA